MLSWMQNIGQSINRIPDPRLWTFQAPALLFLDQVRSEYSQMEPLTFSGTVVEICLRNSTPVARVALQ